MRAHLMVMALVLASWVVGAEKKDEPVVPTNEWHGVVGCAKCDHSGDYSECLPSIKTGSGLFLLKPGLLAPPAIKDFLERIKAGDMKGEYLVHGEMAETDGRKWVAVLTMASKPLPTKGSAPLAYTRPKPDGAGTPASGKGEGAFAGDAGAGGQGRGSGRGRGRKHGGDAGSEEGQ